MKLHFKQKIEDILEAKAYPETLPSFLHEIGYRDWADSVIVLDSEKIGQFHRDIYFFLLALKSILDPTLEEIIIQTRDHVHNTLIPLEEQETRTCTLF